MTPIKSPDLYLHYESSGYVLSDMVTSEAGTLCILPPAVSGGTSTVEFYQTVSNEQKMESAILEASRCFLQPSYTVGFGGASQITQDVVLLQVPPWAVSLSHLQGWLSLVPSHL